MKRLIKKLKKILKKKIPAWHAVILGIGVVIAFLLTFFFVRLVRMHRAATPAIVSAVSKKMQVPDETPIVATVADPQKLHDQPFFNGAQTGDKVLIYPTAKEVVLYRPSSDTIIATAPLSE